MESVEKVYPTAEELSRITKNVNCPECAAIFKSESNLNLHFTRTHKKAHLLQQGSPNKIYVCPEVSCMYNNSTHFKQLKLLKQHYLKVHSLKSHICNFCKKGFSTVASRNRHSEYCSVAFTCCDCGMKYACYESLKTHARRKKHSILDKMDYKPWRLISALTMPKSDESLYIKKPQLILSKPSKSVEMILLTDMLEQSCQTEQSASLNNRETQTIFAFRIPQFTVETQTIGDCFTKKAPNISKSMETQTLAGGDAKSVSCNTCVDSNVQRNSSSTQTVRKETNNDLLTTMESQTSLNEHRNSSSTQTNVCDDAEYLHSVFKCCDDYSNVWTQTCEDPLLSDNQTQTRSENVTARDVSHTETQTDSIFQFMNSSSTQTSISTDFASTSTDTSDLLTDAFDFNCNSQTQTDFIDGELFNYCDDYTSSIYTQTCEDLLLGDIGLNDCHTQTVFDDLKTVDSKTIVSQFVTPSFGCKDNVTHMETQTDSFFKQMLEEINA